jgi:hypothetical protein
MLVKLESKFVSAYQSVVLFLELIGVDSGVLVRVGTQYVTLFRDVDADVCASSSHQIISLRTSVECICETKSFQFASERCSRYHKEASYVNNFVP